MASMKKLQNQREWPRNGCDGITGRWKKVLITTIQVNFVLISSETGMKQHIQN